MLRLGLFAILMSCLSAAQGWDVGEFRNGMPKTEVVEALRSWNFGKVIDVGRDGLFAYDLPESPAGRRYLFTFCNDKLVSFDQEIDPSFRNFIVVTSNYSNIYGNPLRVIPYSNVVASGEKDVIAMFWRKGSDYLGVKYALFATGEQLSLTWQVNNNCWQAPR
jgi:hypothetical protein